MSAVDAAMRTVHLLVASVWAGAVTFVALAVVPVARDGTADAAPLERIFGRLRAVSRGSSLLLLLTGGHLAGVGYTVESLTGTTRGYLVVAMVVLWLLLAALVEVGAGRMIGDLRAKRVRAPARDHGRWLLAAAAVGLLLLVDAGLLSAGVV